MRATLSDIAKQVGVSKSLVSMYLNNHRLSRKIAAETKRKIDQAVRELDYRPSFTARALSNGKTRTIGMIQVKREKKRKKQDRFHQQPQERKKGRAINQAWETEHRKEKRLRSTGSREAVSRRREIFRICLEQPVRCVTEAA